MTVYSLCTTGCGARTNGFLMCYECILKDPLEMKSQARRERLASLQRLASTGQPVKRSCLTCIHWTRRDCGLGIPECGPTFAPTCSCYRKSS